MEIVRKYFNFQKGFKFPRLANTFGNFFQISEMEYVTLMPGEISNVGYFYDAVGNTASPKPIITKDLKY